MKRWHPEGIGTPQYYARGDRNIQALYIVRSLDNEDLYGPNNFKLCAEEARRLTRCTGKIHRVVRV